MLTECLGILAVLAITLYVAMQLWCPWIMYDLIYFRALLKLVRLFKFKLRTRELVIDSFEQHARLIPNKTCIIFNDEHFSYKVVNEHANKVARLGLQLGLRPNDVVAVMMQNEPAFMWTFLGFQKIGVSVALVNYHLRLKSLSFSIQSCKPKVFILGRGDELADAFGSVKNDVAHADLVMYDYDTFMNSDPDVSSDPIDSGIRKCIKLSDASSFIFTSGTTGLPKAAIINHIRLIRTIVSFEMFNFTANDVLYESLPLYHSSGLCLGLLCAMSKGATVVLAPKFSVSSFWSDCRKHNVTVIQYIGEMCRYLLSAKEDPRDGEHNIRGAVGNGLRTDIWEDFQNRFKIPRILEFYGSTEGNASVINLFNKAGSVGRISPLVSLVLKSVLVQYDYNTQQPVTNSNGWCIKVKPGDVGLLICPITDKTPFEGYYKRPDESESKKLRNVFKEGDVYFNTGDLFYVDNEYFLFFEDRTGDTYRWKGENVSTTEVSNIMSDVDFIHDVCVYGVTVPGCEGKAGMAAVYLKDGVEMDDQKIQRISQCVQDRLPSYARPRFLRIPRQMILTGTYKQKKMDLVEASFNPKAVNEPLYYYDIKHMSFEPLKDEVFEDIVAGKISF